MSSMFRSIGTGSDDNGVSDLLREVAQRNSCSLSDEQRREVSAMVKRVETHRARKTPIGKLKKKLADVTTMATTASAEETTTTTTTTPTPTNTTKTDKNNDDNNDNDGASQKKQQDLRNQPHNRFRIREQVGERPHSEIFQHADNAAEGTSDGSGSGIINVETRSERGVSEFFRHWLAPESVEARAIIAIAIQTATTHGLSKRGRRPQGKGQATRGKDEGGLRTVLAIRPQPDEEFFQEL